MNVESPEQDLSPWFSTYSVITAQRILGLFNINLNSSELTNAVKNPHNIYYQFLSVPTKNIFNGIILSQAQDYQVYAQKLFIDYLLSNETAKGEESQGFNTRENLEGEREVLVNLGNEFNDLEFKHQSLIAESQNSLISIAKKLKDVLNSAKNLMQKILNEQGIIKDEKIVFHALREAISNYEKLDNQMLSSSSIFWNKIIKELDVKLSDDQCAKFSNILLEFSKLRDEINITLTSFLERADDLEINFKSFRSQFYNVILRSTELLYLLPDYNIDIEKDQENRTSLYFDSKLGE